eukprot:690899-Pyramimonas_sp.AAC.1
MGNVDHAPSEMQSTTQRQFGKHSRHIEKVKALCGTFLPALFHYMTGLERHKKTVTEGAGGGQPQEQQGA